MPHEHPVDVIAIDGPAASGKSTIGYALAQRLGYLFLDTGSMYRAMTLAAIRRGVAFDDAAALTALAGQVELNVLPPGEAADGRQYTILLDGEDVTWALRLPEVEAGVSAVSAVPGVRTRLVERQREMGRRGGIVMVGRDIGTVVMPDAPLKLYIVATAHERARRRLRDRRQLGFDDDFDAILADVVRRDHIDSTREHSPLRPAADSTVIDTTGRSVAELIAQILTLLNHTPTEEPV